MPENKAMPTMTFQELPPVVETSGLDLLLTVSPTGFQLYADFPTPALVALTLKTIAGIVSPAGKTAIDELRGQLVVAMVEMSDAIKLAQSEGPHRPSTEDMLTAGRHLRDIIDSL